MLVGIAAELTWVVRVVRSYLAARIFQVAPAAGRVVAAAKMLEARPALVPKVRRAVVCAVVRLCHVARACRVAQVAVPLVPTERIAVARQGRVIRLAMARLVAHAVVRCVRVARICRAAQVAVPLVLAERIAAVLLAVEQLESALSPVVEPGVVLAVLLCRVARACRVVRRFHVAPVFALPVA